MAKRIEASDILDKMISEAARRGLIHHTAGDEQLDGRTVSIGGQGCVNFASCSYLGLELDPRLIEGAIDATRRYGTQFSSSRAYLSAPPYEALEARLGEVFGGSVLVTPSTSLGHIAALPVLVRNTDVVLVDQLAHHSLQTALELVRGKGVGVELMRHNDMIALEARVATLAASHERVWYVADGIYSMFGDRAPLAEIQAMLGRHPRMRLYIDDAHGMSWTGRNGRGSVLDVLPIHEQMVVATSLNKAFAAGGGALIFAGPEQRRKVRTCGGPMIFSGPVQPPMLGAALASAALHVSGEVHALQAELAAKIARCDELLASYGVAVSGACDTPIRFVETGLPRASYALAEKLLGEGLFVNVATFPAVPMRQAGVRFTVTRHQTDGDLERLVEAIARHQAPQQETAFFVPGAELTLTVAAAPAPLALRHETTIEAIDRAAWDAMFGTRGAMAWDALHLLERSFKDQARPEDRWSFHYYLVTDGGGQPVLATFFTEALWKDDMLADARVSERIERARQHDPYLLTSRVLAMGSLLTEGNHLYLDRGKDWQGALRLVLEAIAAEQPRCGATSLVWRDLPGDDAAMDALMHDAGYLKADLPESWELALDWQDDAAFLAGLSHNARRHQRQHVLPWDGAYAVRRLEAPSPAELEHLYGLYENVRRRNLGLNTFALPRRFFQEVLRDPHWEILALEHEGRVAGFVASYVGSEVYVPLVAGLDYAFVQARGLYRQCLRQAVNRARQLGKTRVSFGLGAPLEKQRFGAVPTTACMYVQLADHYPHEVVERMEEEVTGR